MSGLGRYESDYVSVVLALTALPPTDVQLCVFSLACLACELHPYLAMAWPAVKCGLYLQAHLVFLPWP